MKIGEGNTILKLLDSKLAGVLEVIAEQSIEDGLWVSNEESKKQVCLKLHMSSPTYFRYIKNLTTKGVLLMQPGKGVYKLNPELISL